MTDMGGTTRTLTYQYDRNGNRTRITHPDSVQFAYSYDPGSSPGQAGLGRPTWLTDPSSALNHSYEPWGPVDAIYRIGGASGRWTTPDGRLISLSHYNGPSFTLDTYWAFTHNPAGQIATRWGMSEA
jgi:YD repeat-containing protein